MRIYGYKSDGSEDLCELDEITFQATPWELEKIAEFLFKYAQVMKKPSNSFEHAHLADENVDWNENPDIIVFKEN